MTKRFSSLLKKALILCCAAGTLASCAIPGIGLREADADPFLDLAKIRELSETRVEPAEPETEEAPPTTPSVPVETEEREPAPSAPQADPPTAPAETDPPAAEPEVELVDPDEEGETEEKQFE